MASAAALNAKMAMGPNSFRSGRYSTTHTTTRSMRPVARLVNSHTTNRRASSGTHNSPEQSMGLKEARGATVSASQVPSVRLPRYVISTEIVFGMPKADHSPRRGKQRSPLRRWGANRYPYGIRASRRSPRSRHRARPVSRATWWVAVPGQFASSWRCPRQVRSTLQLLPKRCTAVNRREGP
jgi:hypothetical protein